MKQYFLGLVVLWLVLAACGSPVTPDGSGERAAGQARQVVADRLGLPLAEVGVVSQEQVTFPDVCLDLALPTQDCTQVQTPGYRFEMTALDWPVVVHSDVDAQLVRLAGVRPGQNATLALQWELVGGIAGFCQQLLVYVTGEAHATRCGAGADEYGPLRPVPAEDLFVLYTFLNQYRPFSFEEGNEPDVADAMFMRMVFRGGGQDLDGEEFHRELADFASGLYADLTRTDNAGPSPEPASPTPAPTVSASHGASPAQGPWRLVYASGGQPVAA